MTASPVGLQLNSTTGLIQWTPKHGSNPNPAIVQGGAVDPNNPYFAFQVSISQYNNRIKTSMDFIFQMVTIGTTPPPNMPVVIPPQNPIIAYYGQEVNVQIQYQYQYIKM